MAHDKFTKIVATLGPASDSEAMIKNLIRAGVNVFRFNTKHATVAWHEERINRVQNIADSINTPVGILLDLQGPELRIETKDEEPIQLNKNDEIILESSFKSPNTKLVIPHKVVFDALKKGDVVLIEDGHIRLHVVSVSKTSAKLRANRSYIIKHRKGVNLPGKHIKLPSLIEADLKQLEMASLNKVDFIALSFVRNIKDVEILRSEMKKRKIEASVILKIENQQAINNIDELVEASDGVMVARGDLGVEVPIEELAFWQRTIIDKCKAANKPVITATQMLESMIYNPMPTRAEATDVSNAIYAGSDAIMLSGETAGGSYPVETVEIMSKIARYTESVKPFNITDTSADDSTQLIAAAAMKMVEIEGLEVDKFVVFSQTGYTARVISAYRPNIPIIAVTNKQSTVEKLTLSYGVFGYRYAFPKGKLVSPNFIINKLGKTKAIKKGDRILVIHGARWKKPGLTNSITYITY